MFRLPLLLREECIADDVVLVVVRLYMRLLSIELRDDSLDRLVRLLITTANANLRVADFEAGYQPNASTVVRGHKGLPDPAKPVTPRKILIRHLVCDTPPTIRLCTCYVFLFESLPVCQCSPLHQATAS